ncbi:hypothetical protein NKH86_21165 [Mesorhizobium sp. M0913]|uniref:hypothetical protein n=1 Tax=Mesorhizobium sp. M0913 TaxID=2957026 RepID=UPI00333B436B
MTRRSNAKAGIARLANIVQLQTYPRRAMTWRLTHGSFRPERFEWKMTLMKRIAAQQRYGREAIRELLAPKKTIADISPGGPHRPEADWASVPWHVASGIAHLLDPC